MIMIFFSLNGFSYSLVIWDQVDFNQLEEKYPADAVFEMHPFMVTEI